MKFHFMCFTFGPDFPLYVEQVKSIQDLKLGDRAGNFYLFTESGENERNSPAFTLNDEQAEFCAKNSVRVAVTAGNYTPFPSYTHCLAKVLAYRAVCADPTVSDDDYVVDVDSDVVFIGSRVLDVAEPYGMVGSLCEDQFRDTRFGRWTHFSGVTMLLKVKYLRRVSDYTNAQIDALYAESRSIDLPPVHDCFTSYLMSTVCPQNEMLNVKMVSDDYYGAYVTGEFDRSLSLLHFSGFGPSFLGHTLHALDGRNYRYDIPRVISLLKNTPINAQ